jgi:large subunit ribosomal protein L7/L12
MAEEKKQSKAVEKLVDEISTLTVVELSELVSALKEKFGVEAVAMAAPAAAPAGGAAEAGAPAAAAGGANQTVVLTGAGANKIAVIKALREINPNMGLKEAKDATEGVPFEVLKDAKADAAKEAADKLKAAGATVELK